MKARLLVIAEDRSVRTSLARVFENEDHIVLSARDADEGIYLTGCAPVELVIWDLPGDLAGAFAAIRKLKQANPALPLIILADKTDPPGLEIPAEGFVFKPVNIADLLQVVREWLSESISSARLDGMARAQAEVL